MAYTSDFFSSHHPGAANSAARMVPQLLELSEALSVVDVGCGIGTWLAECSKRGIADFHGFDGPWVRPEQLVIPPATFTSVDLSRTVPTTRGFDLALSLEVAEHLPEASADTFVASLTSLAPIVVFSAAIPMQGGTGHVNEQWPRYWAAKFAARGYSPIDCVRPLVWKMPGVEWWYAQNTIVYASEAGLAKSARLRELASTHGGEPRALVHPGCFVAKATQPIGLRRMLRELPSTLAGAWRGAGAGKS
jgi:hypothetical protein